MARLSYLIAMLPFDAAVFDLDGTLLDSRKRISGRTRKALEATRDAGLHAIFATARPPRDIDHLGLEEFGARVYYNGAMARCALTGLAWSRTLAPDLTARILHFLDALGGPSLVSVEIEDRWLTHQDGDHSLRFHVSDPPLRVALEEITGRGCNKILVQDCAGYEALRSEFGDGCTILKTDAGALIQIMARAATKENAVAALCAHNGWRLDRILCFGDDFNDLGLFRACGHPVAMGNAIPELKAIAREVTRVNDEDGVAIVLERILDNA